MNEIDKTNLTDQTDFRLNQVSNIEIFLTKINQRKHAVKNKQICC